MNIFTEVMLITTIFVALISVWIILIFGLFYFLAKKNIFFTFGYEDRAKIVVMGGRYIKTILGRKNTTIDPLGWIVTATSQQESGPKNWLARKFGIYWIGLWPFCRIFTYHSSWITWKQEVGEASCLYQPKFEEGYLDYVLISDYPYYVELLAAECKDKIPLDWKFIITTRCANPYLAVFKAKDWPKQMAALVRSSGRALAGQNTYDEIISNTGLSRAEIEDRIKTNIEGELHERYGLDIIRVSIIEINPPPSFVEISTRAYRDQQTGLGKIELAKAEVTVAEQEKQALITKAEGEKVAEILTSEGRAQAIVNTSQAEAVRLQQLGTTLDKTPGSDLIVAADTAKGLNSKTVIVTGEVGNLPKQLLGLVEASKSDEPNSQILPSSREENQK